MWPTAASARLAVLALAGLAVGACAAAPAEVHVCTTPYRPFVYESPPDGADPQSSSRTVMEIPEDGDEPPEQRVTARRVSMQDFQRAYQGFDVDLFAAVSQLALSNATITFTVTVTYPEALYLTRIGECDIALGGFIRSEDRQACRASCPHPATPEAATNENVCCLQFSEPYERTGFSVVTRQKRQQGMHNLMWTTISSPDMVNIACTLVISLLLSGHLIWYFERTSNSTFSPEFHGGVDDGLWWSVVTLTTVGYGDKVPVTVLGRLLGVLWMFTGFVLMGLMGAKITSQQILDVSSLTTVNGHNDIRGMRLCTLDAAYVEFMQGLDLEPAMVEKDFRACYMHLKEKHVEAVLYDRYGAISDLNPEDPLSDQSGTLRLPNIEQGVVISPILQAVHMAMAFPAGSDILPLVDYALRSHILQGKAVFSEYQRQGWSIEIARERWLDGDDTPYEPIVKSGEEESTAGSWWYLGFTAMLVLLHLGIQVGGLWWRSRKYMNEEEEEGTELGGLRSASADAHHLPSSFDVPAAAMGRKTRMEIMRREGRSFAAALSMYNKLGAASDNSIVSHRAIRSARQDPSNDGELALRADYGRRAMRPGTAPGQIPATNPLTDAVAPSADVRKMRIEMDQVKRMLEALTHSVSKLTGEAATPPAVVPVRLSPLSHPNAPTRVRWSDDA